MCLVAILCGALCWSGVGNFCYIGCGWMLDVGMLDVTLNPSYA